MKSDQKAGRNGQKVSEEPEKGATKKWAEPTEIFSVTTKLDSFSEEVKITEIQHKRARTGLGNSVWAESPREQVLPLTKPSPQEPGEEAASRRTLEDQRICENNETTPALGTSGTAPATLSTQPRPDPAQGEANSESPKRPSKKALVSAANTKSIKPKKVLFSTKSKHGLSRPKKALLGATHQTEAQSGAKSALFSATVQSGTTTALLSAPTAFFKAIEPDTEEERYKMASDQEYEEARKALKKLLKKHKKNAVLECLLQDDEFIAVEKGPPATTAEITAPPAATSNQFQVLADQEMDIENNEEESEVEEPAPWQEVTRKPQPRRTPQYSKINEKHNNDVPRKNRPPPILTYNIRIKEFDKLLATKGVSVRYRMLPGGAINVLCETTEHHKIVMEILKSRTNGGHSYTPKDERKAILIMKDIHFSVDIEDITQDLEEQTGLKPIVKRMEKKTDDGVIKLNSVLVTISEDKSREMAKVQYVANCLVRWDRFRKSTITQCHRCQQFGHIAQQCLNKYRCVKCDQQHEPGQCKLGAQVESDKLYCHNCQATGHPASFRGCPKYVEKLEKIEKQQKRKEELRQNLRARKEFAAQSVNNIYNGVPYSQTLKGQAPLPPQSVQQPYQQPPQQAYQQPQQQPSAPSGGFLDGEFERHFGMGMMDVIMKARAFKPHYQTITDEGEQKAALLRFAMSLC